MVLVVDIGDLFGFGFDYNWWQSSWLWFWL
jgi:hypothetical protein